MKLMFPFVRGNIYCVSAYDEKFWLCSWNHCGKLPRLKCQHGFFILVMQCDLLFILEWKPVILQHETYW